MGRFDPGEPSLMAESDRVSNSPLHRGENWESVALRRVSARVEDLPARPQEAEDFGWEEGVLEKLRKRLAAQE
jgi:hypothetical protein